MPVLQCQCRWVEGDQSCFIWAGCLSPRRFSCCEQTVDVGKGVFEPFRMVAPVIVVYPLGELLLIPCLQHVGGLLIVVCGVMLKQVYEKGHLGRHSFTPDVN